MTPYTSSTSKGYYASIEATDGQDMATQALALDVLSSMRPPQSYEVVDRIADRLRFAGQLEGGLGGPGRIYAHRAPATKPDRYLVVREPVIPGGRPEHFTRVDAVPVQIMAECAESHPNPAWWLSAIHTSIYETLSGWRPVVDHSTVLLPVKRTVKPSGAAYDADDHAYYASAEYRVTLGPIINETP